MNLKHKEISSFPGVVGGIKNKRETWTSWPDKTCGKLHQFPDMIRPGNESLWTHQCILLKINLEGQDVFGLAEVPGLSVFKKKKKKNAYPWVSKKNSYQKGDGETLNLDHLLWVHTCNRSPSSKRSISIMPSDWMKAIKKDKKSKLLNRKKHIVINNNHLQYLVFFK